MKAEVFLVLIFYGGSMSFESLESNLDGYWGLIALASAILFVILVAVGRYWMVQKGWLWPTHASDANDVLKFIVGKSPHTVCAAEIAASMDVGSIQRLEAKLGILVKANRVRDDAQASLAVPSCIFGADCACGQASKRYRATHI